MFAFIKKSTDQNGAAPLTLLIVVISLIGVFMISNTFNFKDKIFSSLFTKPPSHAETIRIPVLNSSYPPTCNIAPFVIASTQATSSATTAIGVVQLPVSGTSQKGYGSAYLKRVDLFVDGQFSSLLYGYNYPFGGPAFYEVSWDTTKYSNGPHSLTCKAYDYSNPPKTGVSTPVTFTVDNTITINDKMPPTVQIGPDPVNGQTVSGLYAVHLAIFDNASGTEQWGLFVDGKLVNGNFGGPAESQGNGYIYYWDTTKFTNGSHTLVAKSYDQAHNLGTSASIVVMVKN